ncbi:hypothetical protein HGRIS_001828 [Hohenbuehelia grisea]|uniref:Ricin B lectin domain-containing protein n=1 Tax=Hohenbuehelia grisea TaxID=104357 RepID=A0ABR3JJP6_9AGAR
MMYISQLVVFITASIAAVSAIPAKRQAASTRAVQLHPNGVATKCLDVAANKQANNTPVQIFDCNGSGAQAWNLIPGSTHVRLNGTNFCLDAGDSPASGTQMKIYTCFENLPAQEWFWTTDDRIALENQGQCLDMTNGNLANGTPVQIWKCTDSNTNQIWTATTL